MKDSETLTEKGKGTEQTQDFKHNSDEDIYL